MGIYLAILIRLWNEGFLRICIDRLKDRALCLFQILKRRWLIYCSSLRSRLMLLAQSRAVSNSLWLLCLNRLSLYSSFAVWLESFLLLKCWFWSLLQSLLCNLNHSFDDGCCLGYVLLIFWKTCLNWRYLLQTRSQATVRVCLICVLIRLVRLRYGLIGFSCWRFIISLLRRLLSQLGICKIIFLLFLPKRILRISLSLCLNFFLLSPFISSPSTSYLDLRINVQVYL